MTGEEIRALRELYGETQEEFARRVHVTITTINRWENNRAKPSKLATENLRALARRKERAAC